MTTIDNELAASLEKAVGNVSAEREQIEADYKHRLAHLDQRESLFQSTLAALRSNGNGNGQAHSTKKTEAKSSDHPKLSISEERLAKVIEYLDKHPRVKQSELVEQLSFNSGTVSVALRILAEKGKVQKVETEKGSNEWVPVKKRGRGRPKKVAAS